MRVAIYRRVSTEMQKEEGFSLEAQKMRLEAFALSQGWTIVDDYCDDGYSAKNLERPHIQRMIKDMKKKKFDVILVYRLDRFVRTVTDLHKLLQLMDRYDVKFKSSTEAFDTTTATGRMFITLVATIAQWERETIAERVYEAMLKRSETGKRNGAPAPYGYDLEDGKLILNYDEAKWVKFIFAQYLTHGSQNIAKKLNSRGITTKKGEIWSDFSVRYTLKNPIYSGYVRWNYESVSGGHRKKTGEEVIVKLEQEDFEPIITKKKWDEIQQIIDDRYNMAFRSQNHYPFSSIGKCAKCGKSIIGNKKVRSNGFEHRFYKCQGRFRFGICDAPVIPELSIEKAFLEILDININQLVNEIDVEQNQETDIDRNKLNKQLEKILCKKERTKEIYTDGDMTKAEYRKKMNQLTIEENELRGLLEEQEQHASTEDIKQILSSIKEEWKELSYESKKHAIHLLFKYITIEIVEPSKPNKLAVVKISDYSFK
ncbi:MAG TPA: recombinase family protein [Bacillus bacterium]|nr:recombinase family protein [Bacillus sp. (in: firmicutes)]